MYSEILVMQTAALSKWDKTLEGSDQHFVTLSSALQWLSGLQDSILYFAPLFTTRDGQGPIDPQLLSLTCYIIRYTCSTIF